MVIGQASTENWPSQTVGAFFVPKCVCRCKCVEKTWFLNYNFIKRGANSPYCPAICRFVRCVLTGQGVEFNQQNEMQGGSYGKENNG